MGIYGYPFYHCEYPCGNITIFIFPVNGLSIKLAMFHCPPQCPREEDLASLRHDVQELRTAQGQQARGKGTFVPMENGDFTVEHGDFTVENGDFAMEHRGFHCGTWGFDDQHMDFMGSKWLVSP